jgi:hypothetical protein
MQAYLKAKSAQLAIELAQLEGFVDDLERDAVHPVLVSELKNRVSQMRQLHQRLSIIAGISDVVLLKHAHKFLRDYAYHQALLRVWYLPACFDRTTGKYPALALMSTPYGTCYKTLSYSPPF